MDRDQVPLICAPSYKQGLLVARQLDIPKHGFRFIHKAYQLRGMRPDRKIYCALGSYDGGERHRDFSEILDELARFEFSNVERIVI